MEERYQIGSITSGYRVIRPGEEYDKYFPRPQAQDRIIIEDGEVGDTVDLMKRVVLKAHRRHQGEFAGAERKNPE